MPRPRNKADLLKAGEEYYAKLIEMADSMSDEEMAEFLESTHTNMAIKLGGEYIVRAKEYIEMPKLTPELLRVFIRKIEVMEKTEKYSRTCGNTIIIHYTFEYPRQCAAIPTNNEKTA